MSVTSLALLAGASGSVPARALYSPKETETLLGISHATCYRLINSGKLDARKIGGKTAITAASIEQFLARLPRAGCAA